MQRSLYLVRHAQSADKQSGQADHERELTPDGKHDAHALGIFFSNQNFFFDQVYCSTAVRAKQTLEGIQAAYSSNHPFAPQFSDELYHGTAENYGQLIQKTTITKGHILLIGHNPSISQLVVDLCHQPFLGFTPGSVVLLNSVTPDWKQFIESRSYIQFFRKP